MLLSMKVCSDFVGGDLSCLLSFDIPAAAGTLYIAQTVTMADVI